MSDISVREHLTKQGVTDEDAIRAHMGFILDMEKHTGRKLDLTRYAPNPANPNSLPPLMG